MTDTHAGSELTEDEWDTVCDAIQDYMMLRGDQPAHIWAPQTIKPAVERLVAARVAGEREKVLGAFESLGRKWIADDDPNRISAATAGWALLASADGVRKIAASRASGLGSGAS